MRKNIQIKSIFLLLLYIYIYKKNVTLLGRTSMAKRGEGEQMIIMYQNSARQLSLHFNISQQ